MFNLFSQINQYLKLKSRKEKRLDAITEEIRSSGRKTIDLNILKSDSYSDSCSPYENETEKRITSENIAKLLESDALNENLNDESNQSIAQELNDDELISINRVSRIQSKINMPLPYAPVKPHQTFKNTLVPSRAMYPNKSVCKPSLGSHKSFNQSNISESDSTRTEKLKYSFTSSSKYEFVQV